MNAFQDFYKNKVGRPIFGKLTELLINLGVKPNMMTMAAFIVGLIAVYFLFENNSLFVVFILLHLLFDILDGQIARISNHTTNFGAWMDHISDRSITLLILIKTYFYAIVPANLFFSVIFLWFLQNLLYIIYKRKISIVYTRTVTLLLFIMGGYYLAFIVQVIMNCLGLFVQLLQIFNVEKKCR
jgi:phosphatidylglycerophosphate synthase